MVDEIMIFDGCNSDSRDIMSIVGHIGRKVADAGQPVTRDRRGGMARADVGGSRSLGWGTAGRRPCRSDECPATGRRKLQPGRSTRPECPARHCRLDHLDGCNATMELDKSLVLSSGARLIVDKQFPIDTIQARGHSIKFLEIPKEDRYLISEMACKTYEAPSESEADLKQFLIDNYKDAVKLGKSRISVKDLFSKEFKGKSKEKYTDYSSPRCKVDLKILISN